MQINYEGTSGAMESRGAEILWQRSLKKWKMQYVNVLSDGDTNTYDKLCKLDPYNGVPIEKEECINHMSKRLGTGLRELVKTEKAKGVTLGGKAEGSLKETTIMKLTTYYRLLHIFILLLYHFLYKFLCCYFIESKYLNHLFVRTFSFNRYL